MESDEQAIRELQTTCIEAVNAGDVARLLSLLTDDAVFFNPGQAPLGREDFPVAFTTAHRELRIRCVGEPQEVAVTGSFAYTMCADSLSRMPRAGGQAMSLTGHRMTIYRTGADRGWRLARDAHTLSPVAG